MLATCTVILIIILSIIGFKMYLEADDIHWIEQQLEISKVYSLEKEDISHSFGFPCEGLDYYKIYFSEQENEKMLLEIQMNSKWSIVDTDIEEKLREKINLAFVIGNIESEDIELAGKYYFNKEKEGLDINYTIGIYDYSKRVLYFIKVTT